MAEVFSESLDFPKVKARAVQSRSYRVKLPPTNAGTYDPSSVIEFELQRTKPVRIGTQTSVI